MEFVGIIPARYASNRFPGKPLVDIGGKTMIQRVYERCCQVLGNVIVATDDERILREVERFGGTAEMTSPSHPSGTDRCAEILKIMEKKNLKLPDVVINIQGDEPFIKPEQIISIMDCFFDGSTQIATLIIPVSDPEILDNDNKVKVVTDANGYALYFSRSVIPFIRNTEKSRWITSHKFYQHLGMYAYRTTVLKEIVSLKPSSLERAESLEQLRWLENGYRIRTSITQLETFCIDTPEDLQIVLEKGVAFFENS